MKHSLGQFAGQPLVIIGSGRDAQDENKLWGNRIRQECCPDLPAVGVADLRGVPWFMKGKVKRDISVRYEGPEWSRIPILLDWDGKLSRAYDFVPAVSNVILIDAGGIVRTIIRGKSQENFAAFVKGVRDVKSRNQ